MGRAGSRDALCSWDRTAGNWTKDRAVGFLRGGGLRAEVPDVGLVAFFHSLCPASDPWIRVGSPSQPQLPLAEAPSLRKLERRWTAAVGQFLLCCFHQGRGREEGVATVDSSS